MHKACTFGIVLEKVAPLLGIPHHPVMFSYLPLSHIAERMAVEVNVIYNNGTIAFAESLETFAANLADRGATIEPVDVHYPKRTPLGKRVVTPQDLGKPRTIKIGTIERALGQELGEKTVKQALETYGYDVSIGKGSVKAKLPPYRQDLLHAMDVVEDVAMSRGYGSFAPEMPAQIGRAHV